MKQKKGWKRIIKNTKGKKVKDRESVEGTTQSSRSSGMGDTRDDDDNGDGNDYDAEVEINIELADKWFVHAYSLYYSSLHAQVRPSTQFYSLSLSSTILSALRGTNFMKQLIFTLKQRSVLSQMVLLAINL